MNTGKRMTIENDTGQYIGNQQEAVKPEPSVISVEIKERKPLYGQINGRENVFYSGSPVSAKQQNLARDESFVKVIKEEAMKLERTMNSSAQYQTTPQKIHRKKLKKSIFISYSPDAGFEERKFIVETVRQLKENNLSEDIWFDKDENNTDSPCWFSFRLEAVERCRAAVLFLSDSYFSCAVTTYESKAVMDRHRQENDTVHIFPVLYSLGQNTVIPRHLQKLGSRVVDLTNPDTHRKSIAEKASVVVGSLMMDLERIATIGVPPPPTTAPDGEFTGEYKLKTISQWTARDLQEWLFKLGIKEFYRQSLAENMVDGFLLMSMTDHDMVNHIGIDSRVVRKKMMQQILQTLDKENKLQENWHLRARSQKSRSNCLYLVYDPTDARLAQTLKEDLMKKGFQVFHHEKLGQSKEEFLQLNGPQMAQAMFVLVVMTTPAAASPFVFHEVLFGDWLGKKLVTAMFNNTWSSLRVSLRAVLGDCTAVDFETKMYMESLGVLEYHLKPLRTVPGVVLEQAYLNKMSDGLRPLSQLANSTCNGAGYIGAEDGDFRVFISYQWDMQSRVEDIRRILAANQLYSWADMSSAGVGASSASARGHSSVSTRSSLHGGGTELSTETLLSQIQRIMRSAAVVLCCVTPKYLQSDNCIKDLTLAESLHKPIIPVMLRFCPWPPDGAPVTVRKILVKLNPIDLSGDKLFKQNMPALIDKIKKYDSLN